MSVPERNIHMNAAEEEFTGFQLTREGKPPLDHLIDRLMENYNFFSDMDRKEIVWILRLCGRRS